LMQVWQTVILFFLILGDYLSPDINGPISTDSPEFEAAEKGSKSRLKIHEQQRNTFC
jgi:hypothetical protein